jgi:hypothetical protein
MPIYHRLGTCREAPHGVPPGTARCYSEELIGNKGFVGPASLLYHVQQPTQVRGVRLLKRLGWEEDDEREFFATGISDR